MSYHSRNYVRNGQMYSVYGAGLATAPTVAMNPAVVTVETYIKKKEPRDVTPEDIASAMEKLFIRPRAKR